jgi:hypothetical protein
MEPTDYLRWGPTDLGWQAPILEPAAVPIETIPDDFDDPSIVELMSGNTIKYPNTASRTLAKNTAKTLLGSGYNKDSKLVEPFIRKHITENNLGAAALMGLAYGLPVIGTVLDMAEGNIPGLLDIASTAGLFRGPIKAARKIMLPSAIGGSAQGTLPAAIAEAVTPKPSLDDYTQDQIDEWWQDAIRRYK